MLEAPILSTQPLPDYLQWLDRIKTQSEQVAKKLEVGLPTRSQQIQHCADWVRVSQFKGGYQILSSRKQRYCHLRGCPMCERTRKRRLLGRISCGISEVKRLYTSDLWMAITLPVSSCSVAELRNAVIDMNAAIDRFTSRKLFRARGWIRLTDVATWGQTILPSTTFICCVPAAMAKGRHYLSIPDLQALWEDCLRASAPPVETKYFRQDKNKILEEAGKHGAINLAAVDDEIVIEYCHAIDHLNLIRFGGCLRQLMKERPRPKKKYHPSEVANLRAMQNNYFAYLPNPEDLDHRDQFLLYPEFCPDDINEKTQS